MIKSRYQIRLKGEDDPEIEEFNKDADNPSVIDIYKSEDLVQVALNIPHKRELHPNFKILKGESIPLTETDTENILTTTLWIMGNDRALSNFNASSYLNTYSLHASNTSLIETLNQEASLYESRDLQRKLEKPREFLDIKTLRKIKKDPEHYRLIIQLSPIEIRNQIKSRLECLIQETSPQILSEEGRQEILEEKRTIKLYEQILENNPNHKEAQEYLEASKEIQKSNKTYKTISVEDLNNLHERFQHLDYKTLEYPQLTLASRVKAMSTSLHNQTKKNDELSQYSQDIKTFKIRQPSLKPHEYKTSGGNLAIYTVSNSMKQNFQDSKYFKR